jgi:transitional endoplasmic reticulum ATPase
MSSLLDDFVHISGTAEPAGSSSIPQTGGVSHDFFQTTKGKLMYTEGVIVDSIRRLYPKHHLTITQAFNCDLIAFADAHDDVTYLPHGDPKDSLLERRFAPPARRYNDETGGLFSTNVIFGCYDYVFKGNHFLVYIVEGSDGWGKNKFNYILVEDLTSELGHKAAQEQSDELIEAARQWAIELHNEILVFDGGMWQKNSELWQNVQKSNWTDVILEKSKKEAIIDDVLGFFRGAERYKEFGVPWKVGLKPSLVQLRLIVTLERSYILRPSWSKWLSILICVCC